jgi:hypothetical protein
MLTDSPPRKANYREGFHESDRIKNAARRKPAGNFTIHRSGDERPDESLSTTQQHRIVLTEGRGGGVQDNLKFAHKGLADNS